MKTILNVNKVRRIYRYKFGLLDIFYKIGNMSVNTFQTFFNCTTSFIV